MALGKRGNSNLNLTILKIKVKDSELKPVDPFFQITRKVDGEWVNLPDRETFVSGKLVKLANKTTKYKDEDIHQVEAHLLDGEDLFVLDLKFTMLNRSVINSLLSVTDFETPVEISLYTSKKGFPSAAVRQNDELVSWKFNLDDQPKPITVMFKGKEQRDYSPIDNFFIEKVGEFQLSPAKAGKSEVASADKPEDIDIAPDEIPF